MHSASKSPEQEAAEYVKQYARVAASYTILAEKIQKDPRQYLFIGRNSGEFSGNVKYLYLHFLKHVPHTRSWFLTQRREVYKLLSSANLPVLLFPTDKEKLIAQAGTVVIDSISYRNRLFYPLIAKARQVQLWHGVGNKKIGFQLQGASCLEGRDQTLMEDHSDYDLIVSTSEFYTEEVFKKSMHAKEFVSLGYPRTDVFFQPLSKEALLGCDIEAYARVKKASKQGPVVLFVPTFRDNGVNPLTQNVLDLEKFITLLKLKNAHLLIKTHSRTPVSFQNIPDNVTVCDSATDVYPFLPLVDTMITDYSSIYTEYLLLDKPIIFFWSDFEKYMSCDRGFQFPFEAMCPGPKCLTAEDLYRAVDEALQGQDDWKDARQKMRDKSFSHINGGASERIADLLVNQNS